MTIDAAEPVSIEVPIEAMHAAGISASDA